MKIRILTYILFFGVVTFGYAQVDPVQNQFYFNPYIYNPAWVGSHDVEQLFVGVKKQWAGVEGSPTIATFTYEKPLELGASLGAKIVNITEGPVNSLSTQLTAGYRLELGLESFLNFGMALGFAHNTLNTSKLDDPNDPLVIEQNRSNFRFDGGIGFGYQTGKLNIGWAVPRFVAPRPFIKSNDSQTAFSPWNYMIGSLAYTFESGLDWEITPTLLYHYQKDFNNQIEAGIKAVYQQRIFGGGIFRQNVGLTLFAGVNLNNKISTHYLYNFSSPTAMLPNDSHELVVRIQLGRKVDR